MKVNIGRGIERDVDTSALTEGVMAHVVYIGLRNILMDAHAGATKTAGEGATEDAIRAVAEAMVDKKLASLMAGEIRVAGERSRKSVLEKIALAKAELYVAMRPEWRGLKAKDRTEKAKAFLLNEKSIFWKQAQDEIDAQAELGDIDID
jgi:hypothetical protein